LVVAIHVRSLPTKTAQVMDTAFDMSSQCALLAFTNAPKPRQRIRSEPKSRQRRR